MTAELNRLTLALLVGFAVIALSAAFWPVIQADSLLDRADNARNVIAEQRIRRGAIYDRDGERLAYSREDAAGVMERVYPHPAAAGALGYYSLTYGVAGIEAAYDAQLRGEDLRGEWEAWLDEALHRPPQGQDVRATLDLDVQRAVAAALGERAGAVVVAHVPTGEVLALVSQPRYDPNTLDADWDRLTEDRATSPLLNRVTAGLYQPGGAFQTVTLAALLGAYSDLREAGALLNTIVPDGAEPVTVRARGTGQTLTLACLPGTPPLPMTLAEAYLYGCPAPFAAATDGPLTPEQVWERWGALGLLEPPTLAGFETAAGRPPRRLSAQTGAVALAAALTGQGDLTVTPLQMAQVIAAVANGGHGVPFHLVNATRPPGAENWQPVSVPTERPALLRADVAEAVRLAMLQASAQSPHVARARRGGLVLYGHSGLSYAGPEATPYAWFAGFVDQTEGADAAAILAVVVIEGEDDPGAAADVAGAAFAAAEQATDQPQDSSP